MAIVDVVVVAYNSARVLRRCLEPLAGHPDAHLIVVDNASPEPCRQAVEGLPVRVRALPRNLGFAGGCNAGWRAGDAPYVLFLNPDARIDITSLRRLVCLLAAQPPVGAAAPRIVAPDGSLDHSQRRFPRLRSTYAQALFLHRLFPRAAWTDEVIRDPGAYAGSGSPDWASGACLLVRREALERIGGLDEGFFLYCEDMDLCRRLRDEGYELRYDPAALAVHDGGTSAPRAALLPVLAASRIRYARKHHGRAVASLERLGIALGSLTHILVSRGGTQTRVGHARALALAASRADR